MAPALAGNAAGEVSRPQRRVNAPLQFARQHTLGAIGGVIVLLFVLTGLLAPVLASYDPNAVSIRDALQPPSRAHPWVPTTTGAICSAASCLGRASR